MTPESVAPERRAPSIAPAAGIPYDELAIGQTLGFYRYEVTPAVVDGWRAVREANPPRLEPWLTAGRVPEGLVFVYVLRTLMDLAVIPPGGVLARQDLRFVRDLPIGGRLAITMSCVDKALRKGRPFATLRLRIEHEADVAIDVDKHVLWPSGEPAPLRGEVAAVGHDPVPGFALSVSQAAVERYADLSNDHNPLHLDPGFAARGPFGALVVHGVIPAGLLLETIATAPRHSGSLAGHRCIVRYLKPLHPGEPFRIVESDRPPAAGEEEPPASTWRCESPHAGNLVVAEMHPLREVA